MSPAARWYERILRFGPRSLRREFGDDMVAAFDAMLACISQRPAAASTHRRAWRRGARKRRQRLRSVLVVSQVTCSALILVLAGLLMRSAGRVASIDLGLDTANVHTFAIDTREANRSIDESRQFYRTLIETATSFSGVASIGAIDVPPLTGSNQQSLVILPDLAPEPGVGLRRVEFARVSPGYLTTMRIALIAGRPFSEDDTAATPRVVVVNEHLASTFWPGESAVGKRFAFRTAEDPIELEVVGVARDSKIRTPADQDRPLVYGHWEQFGDRAYTIVARVESPAVATRIRDYVSELDPVLAAAGLGQLIRWMLFGLSPFDPLTFLSIAALLLTIAAVACWLPARRAAATNPVNALRAE